MSKDLIKLIKGVLDDRIQPLFVLVFGSYVKGITRDDSDLDIAYYSLKKLTDYERFLLANLSDFTKQDSII
jgi:uncharacterized protein